MDGWSEWTGVREAATRYARRQDAEAVHMHDEDAWTVVPYTPDATQTREAEEERAAVAIAKVLGIDLQEACVSNDEGPCDSDTCPGALTDDHDTEEHRERIYRMARAALNARGGA